MDLVDGKPTGAVRISFGYMSTIQDAENFLKFIKECFVKNQLTDDKHMSKVVPIEKDKKGLINVVKNTCVPVDAEEEISKENRENARNFESGKAFPAQQFLISADPGSSLPSLDKPILTDMFLYPVKSCGAFKVI